MDDRTILLFILGYMIGPALVAALFGILGGAIDIVAWLRQKLSRPSPKQPSHGSPR